MAASRVAEFSIVVSADRPTEPVTGPDDVPAVRLRAALVDAGVTRVDVAATGDAPGGTRGIELLGVFALIVTVVQTAESVARVVEAIRGWVDRFAGPRRVLVTVGGVELEVAAGADVTPIVTALLAQPGRLAAGVRRALVIANADYEDQALAALRAPSRDADALARVLGDPAIGGFDVDLLMDADERTVRRRLAAFFADRDRDDLLLLHFSCHGVKDQNGRLYLAARDTDLTSLSATGVAAAFVHDQLSQTQSRRVVLMLDCCYSGAFNRGVEARADRSVHIGDEFPTGTGRIVLTASSATEYAFESGELTRAEAGTSVFTTALVDGLSTGAADLDGDGEISVDELYDYTYRRVRDRVPGQTPMKWTFGVEGSLTVARSVRPATLPEAVRADLAGERVILRLEAVAALRTLRTGPNPSMADRATSELLRLHTEDDSSRVRAAAAEALNTTPPTPLSTQDQAQAQQPHTQAHAEAPPLQAQDPAQAQAADVDPGSAGTSGAVPRRESPRAQLASAPSAPPSSELPLPHGGNVELSTPSSSAGAGEPSRARPVVAHPTLVTLLVAVGLIALVQAVEMVIVGQDVQVFSGINVLAVVPVVAIIGVVTAARVGEWRWVAGMSAVLALVVGRGLLVSSDPYSAGNEGLVRSGVLWIDRNAATEGPGSFLVWLAVTLLPVLWFAVSGPARPQPRGDNLPDRPRPRGDDLPDRFQPRGGVPGRQGWNGQAVRRFVRHPGLLVSVGVALAVSLTGAAVLDELSSGSTSVFGLVRPQLGNVGRTSVVGLGNVASSYQRTGHNWATALWCAGWLALLITAAVALVTLVRLRRRWWTVAVGSGVLASVIAGLVVAGAYGRDHQYLIAQHLATMTGLAAAGTLAYALFGPREQPTDD
ncbi:caspase family protein [Actinoplanes bogorensis]|uniref:Caspase family protein n=1 Tax=Paractinoplanes bogorensis TaxID=1610840 RepID=A0ABS5Z4G5_9ACTN|nr:caspase family protein [Actinoplanes bogorensis]MBU2669315.1 caspase family protein [Actinoplanes bogorensis]